MKEQKKGGAIGPSSYLIIGAKGDSNMAEPTNLVVAPFDCRLSVMEEGLTFQQRKERLARIFAQVMLGMNVGGIQVVDVMSPDLLHGPEAEKERQRLQDKYINPDARKLAWTDGSNPHAN